MTTAQIISRAAILADGANVFEFAFLVLVEGPDDQAWPIACETAEGVLELLETLDLDGIGCHFGAGESAASLGLICKHLH